MNPICTIFVSVLAAGLILSTAPVFARSPKAKTIHGAIAVNRDTKVAGYAYNFKTALEAKREALKQCGERKCEVLASFKNGCAVVADDRAKLTAMSGATRDEAETKVMRKCGKDCTVLAWACTR